MKRYRVMVIEEEAIIALHLKRVLQSIGIHEVITISPGEKALCLLKDSKCDLVILDTVLPGKSRLLQTIKQTACRKKAPCILLAGSGPDCSKEVPLGSCVIQKPFTNEGIEGKIKTLLKLDKGDSSETHVKVCSA